MQAIEVTRFGGPDVLVVREAPDPVAGPGQVVVNVSVADVLFVETQIRQGLGGDYFTMKPPYVPGGGVAGRVSSVGEGVDAGWIGQQVVAYTDGVGGYAEKAVASAGKLMPVPDGLGLREAAALLHDGNTAVGLTEGTKVQPGDWVLVTAAGGGLGILLVQLARAAGGRVIGAARGKRKMDLIRELGAEAAVDYSEPGWAEQVREATGGSGADVVFDGVGGQLGRTAYDLTAQGGQFSGHGAPGGSFVVVDPQDAARRGIIARGIEQAQGTGEVAIRRARQALVEAASGRIKPFIGQTFPLEQAADAHAAIEAREVIGKTLLLTRTRRRHP